MLYEPSDWSQAQDRAADMPEKLAELQELWLDEAKKYNVLPLDDRRIERFNAELVGRPELVKGNSQLLFGGMGRLSESSVVNIKIPKQPVTLTRVGGTQTMTVSTWTLDGPQNRKFPQNAAFNFAVGATLTVAAGQDSGKSSITHPGEDLVYLLSGSLELEVDEVYRLRQGDTLHLRTDRPHRWRNPTTRAARAIWVSLQTS